jgi:serpin B
MGPNMAVQSINDFAWDLYHRLVLEQPQANLFFSPYSIASALMMTSEGARGETARQMGAVLRFPVAARRVSPDAQLLPWDMTPVRTGMADLRQQLLEGAGATDPTQVQGIRDTIQALEQEQQTLMREVAVAQHAAHAAGELDQLRQQVEYYERHIVNASWSEQTCSVPPQFLEIMREVFRQAYEQARDRIQALEQEQQTFPRQGQQLSTEEPWTARVAVEQRAANMAGELDRLRQQVDHYELHIANALWGEQTLPFRPQFLETLREAYGADAVSVDFIHNFETARERINRWVEQQTHERLQSPLEPGSVDSSTRLVLANAIYFKGNWAEPFHKANSYEGDFTTSEGTSAKVMFMAAREVRFRYAELLADGTRNEPVLNPERMESHFKPNPDGLQVLELPYRGHTLSMLVLLPKSPEGLAALEKKLTADTFTRWMDALQEQQVHVFVPKFTLETTYDLPQTLSAMGMPAAFQPGGLTGLSDTPQANLLTLSEVIHKAFVDVNEEGTEAAAVTGITVVIQSARIEPPILEFRADHPFLFLVRDTQSRAILFLGRVMNPEG